MNWYKTAQSMTFQEAAEILEVPRHILHEPKKALEVAHGNYRRLIKKYHPDVSNHSSEIFNLISESYFFLSESKISKNPLLANDEFVSQIIGKRIKPLLDKQKEWKKYEKWRLDHFFGNGSSW